MRRDRYNLRSSCVLFSLHSLPVFRVWGRSSLRQIKLHSSLSRPVKGLRHHNSLEGQRRFHPCQCQIYHRTFTNVIQVFISTTTHVHHQLRSLGHILGNFHSVRQAMCTQRRAYLTLFQQLLLPLQYCQQKQNSNVNKRGLHHLANSVWRWLHGNRP